MLDRKLLSCASWPSLAALFSAGLLGLACEEPKESALQSQPSAQAQALRKAPEPEPPKVKKPPRIWADEDSPVFDDFRVIYSKANAVDKFNEIIAENKEYVDGKVLEIEVDRRAKVAWLAQFLNQLGLAGADSFVIKTDSRPSYPKQLTLQPASDHSKAPGCSVVGMILDDRSSAVWKVSGGTASRRKKGMAGPDLSMTGDTITRYRKGCGSGDTFFFSADDEVGWGLAYDLAASTTTLEDVKFESLVLLKERPVAGRPVEL